MDGWRTYRKHFLVVGSASALLVVGASALRAEGVAPPRDLVAVGRALRQYATDVGTALATDLTAASLTMIGGHPAPPPTLPPTLPPPPIIPGNPVPPPPVVAGGSPGGIPPPPTEQGGPPAAASPEPATIVTGLVGLSMAATAGWCAQRKRRANAST